MNMTTSISKVSFNLCDRGIADSPLQDLLPSALNSTFEPALRQ
jgi:hypothetical protein